MDMSKNSSIGISVTGIGHGKQANKGLKDSWGLITTTWTPYLRDFQGIGIARSIGQTSNANSDMGDDVDISTLTMEQYLALIQDNIRPGVVKPEIGNDVEFEINS
ncbi:hypothetical protein Tco_0910310 [Tanacetum coccineum]|uniref:Uncharacterized protein n=1 Tax=Tanacetum coccineum TaxID=301880 RepID=A0ABQ5CSM9_9ASTR